jgi:transposase
LGGHHDTDLRSARWSSTAGASIRRGPASQLLAEATPDELLASWIGAHVRAFEFYQVCRSSWCRTTRSRSESDLSGVGVVPARPYKPRDKAKVESGVPLVETTVSGSFATGSTSDRSASARVHEQNSSKRWTSLH